MGREGTEPIHLGRGGRWRLERPSLHQSMQAGCSLWETSGPTSLRPLLSEPRGSVQIKKDRRIHVTDSFSTEDEKKQPESFRSCQTREGGSCLWCVSRPALIAVFPLNIITPWCQWFITGCGSVSFSLLRQPAYKYLISLSMSAH